MVSAIACQFDELFLDFFSSFHELTVLKSNSLLTGGKSETAISQDSHGRL